MTASKGHIDDYINDYNINNLMTFRSEYLKHIYTPFGGEYIKCPICENRVDEYYHDLYMASDENENVNNPDNKLYKILFKKLDISFAHYCIRCHLLFDKCCTYEAQGCTDDIYYAKVITECEINGKLYKGIPLFCKETEEQLSEEDCYILENAKFTYNCECPGNCYQKIDCCKQNKS